MKRAAAPVPAPPGPGGHQTLSAYIADRFDEFSRSQKEFETVLGADHVNVEETARKVSRSDVEAAVDAIAQADKLLIAGTDQMAFFASYLRHLLMLLDVRAELVASPSQEALGRLTRIDEAT